MTGTWPAVSFRIAAKPIGALAFGAKSTAQKLRIFPTNR
jgi:hypothetical protein